MFDLDEKRQLHQEICQELNEIYKVKNIRYNDSFGKSFKASNI
jgi:hypothetical protein